MFAMFVYTVGVFHPKEDKTMTEQTKAILKPVLDGDSSIDAATRAAIFDLLEGRGTATAADGKRRDWIMTRAEIAERLKCSQKTVSRYVQRGMILPFCFGAQGRRASNGYSGLSVEKLIEEGAAAALERATA